MTRVLVALCMMVLIASVVRGQEADEASRIAANWKKGSEWQVGDNIQPVAEARKAVVAAGDAGLKYALTRLATTDGLEIRCLDEVLLAFGDKAVEALLDRVGDDNVNARRNVGRILGSFKTKEEDAAKGLDAASITRIARALLDQFSRDTDVAAKFWQVTGPARWKVGDTIGAVLVLSREANERVRVRSIALFSNFLGSSDVLNRLFELLRDERYFVRDAAVEMLKKAEGEGCKMISQRLSDLASKASLTSQDLRTMRMVIGVVAVNPSGAASWNLVSRLCEHSDANVRAEAYTALVDLALLKDKPADLGATPEKARKMFQDRRAKEQDPYAKACLEAALERVSE